MHNWKCKIVKHWGGRVEVLVKLLLEDKVQYNLIEMLKDEAKHTINPEES